MIVAIVHMETKHVLGCLCMSQQSTALSSTPAIYMGVLHSFSMRKQLQGARKSPDFWAYWFLHCKKKKQFFHHMLVLMESERHLIYGMPCYALCETGSINSMVVSPAFLSVREFLPP
jgi:hypothetical protein